MKYTKEQIKQIEKIVSEKIENLDDLEIEEVEEIIFVEQIEEGEVERENFYEAITKMGLPYIKKGRIPYEEFEKIAVELCNFLKESSNPKSDIKDALKMKTDKGIKKINERIQKSRKIRDKDKQSVITINKKIHDEIKELEKNKVKVNQNLMWSIYMIKRGEKRFERFEEDGQDIELLKLQNSFIDEETIKELKEIRSEYYEGE